MKIICAGLSKTGTTSLAAALRILGFSVHDYEEHIEYNEDEYIQAFQGKKPDFAAMYKKVDAVTDYPACFFWKEIRESYPAAKVILSERDDDETWINSMLLNHVAWERTIRSLRWLPLGLVITPTGRKWDKFDTPFTKLFLADYEGKDRRAKLAQLYLEHNSQVKASVSRDQLLVYNVKQGWKPLCEFLGVDVPDVPFPRLNVQSAGMEDWISQSVVGRRIFNELMLISSIVVIIIAMSMFIIVRGVRSP